MTIVLSVTGSDSSTSGDIFIAGLDLENNDIRSHARPYSLDRFMEQKAERLNPVYSQTFRRSSLLKAGGSYDIYAAWFEKQLSSYPRPLHSLGKNNSVFSSTSNLSRKDAETQRENGKSPNNALSFAPLRLGVSSSLKTITLEFSDDLSLRAYGVLEKALQDPLLAAALLKELGPVLFSGKSDPSSHDLTEALYSLRGAANG